METGCHSLHRLKHRAVITMIIVFSLLFYIVYLNMHYYQRMLELVGMLRNVDDKVQQMALNDLFTDSLDAEDGTYILIKNGYQFTGKYYLYIDYVMVLINASYLILTLFLLKNYIKSTKEDMAQIEKELDYLKEEIEHVLFDTQMKQNDVYRECNYLLDRLEKKMDDLRQINRDEFDKMINFHQNIIHQINTPLNTIEILIEYLYCEGKIDKFYLDNMNYAITKASDLSYIYLRSSKLDTGRVEFKFEVIELHDLINEIFESLKVYANYYHTMLVNNCEKSFICADTVWMKEAIKNVVKNAVENAGENKRLEVSSKTTTVSTIIYIDDNSDNDSVIENINFERFESSQSGIGIGLHLCKQIVDAHLGDISVSKNSVGGLRFTIVIPKQIRKDKVILEEFE